MAVVQSTYSERINPAVEGQVANETDYNIDTKTVETVAGIGFGRAVTQGTADKGVVLGGQSEDFVGVSVRDVTLPAAQADKYARYDQAAVLNKGDVWLKPASSVVAGGPVHFSATTGVFNDTGDEGPLEGARWMTSCDTDGIAIARFGEPEYSAS